MNKYTVILYSRSRKRYLVTQVENIRDNVEAVVYSRVSTHLDLRYKDAEIVSVIPTSSHLSLIPEV